LNRAYRDLSPAERLIGFLDKGNRGKMPSWAWTIDAERDTQVIHVSAQSYAPEVSAHLANRIVQTYLTDDLKRTTQAARQGRIYIQNELQSLRKQLDSATLRLARYQRSSGIVSPRAEEEGATSEMFGLRRELVDAETGLTTAETGLKTIDDDLRRTDPQIQSGETLQENPEFVHVREQMAELRDKIIEASHEFRPSAAEYRKLQQRFDEQQSELKKVAHYVVSATIKSRNPTVDYLQQKYASALVDRITNEDRIKSISAVLDQRMNEYRAIPTKERTYTELTRESEEIAHTFGLLTDKYYELLVTEQSGIPNAMVGSEAMPSESPTYPDMRQGTILSILVGILFGIVAAAIMERVDRRIHDPDQIERITGLTTLATVPAAKSSSGSGRLLIDHVENGHGFLESFRLLRNNIEFSSPDEVKRVVGVTSSAKSEGKSTVASNLAIAYGLDGKRVLLMDMDLRRPAVHKQLQINRDPGFTNVVTGNASLEDTVVETPFENVHALTSGPLPPRPNEFLNSRHARQVLEQARNAYDVVIVDAPPSAGLSDFQVISTFVDGALLVVSLDETVKDLLAASVKTLKQSRAPMLGVVINKMQQGWSSYGYYSYYYNYDADGEDKRVRRQRKKTGSRSE
jgi:capsular exopolysaccharide synthesis family protein